MSRALPICAHVVVCLVPPLLLTDATTSYNGMPEGSLRFKGYSQYLDINIRSTLPDLLTKADGRFFAVSRVCWSAILATSGRFVEVLRHLICPGYVSKFQNSLALKSIRRQTISKVLATITFGLQ
ncbi:hypothetical protein BDP55DRAFT_635921 [Colletotrichum godetiae]|uniref:Secreted protein n=1 Tax=Colletotrichum godetiae TaxID=1209918 RepID=A0AAJ0EP44_9PEZI|nr:uncharacterized protein BDP55DRAFT_635921 [Colletotrichum godetiae]KAK1671271.1 hypothetical protein BDP55DRAFT_635921 [Colletotrichum godetiae]